MRPFLLAALLCALAAPAAAQQRGFELVELEKLLRSHVSSARVIVLAQQRCIHFVPDDAALAQLTTSGATRELLDALRAPGQCRTGPAAAAAGVAPAPASDAPASAPPPAPAPRRSPATGFLGLAYTTGAFTPKGGDEQDSGGGAAIDFGVNVSPYIALFIHGDYVDVTSDAGDAYGLRHADLGARVYLSPARWRVRPFAEGSGVVFGMDFTEAGGTETERSLDGFGVSGGAGVQLRFTRTLALEGSYRLMSGSLSTEAVDGDEGELDDPVSGRTRRLQVGLSWIPAAR
ncbi:MAG TPA: outer membrane beta-barrel protein [Longimicrobium sp.]